MLKRLTDRAARRALLLVVLASATGCSTYSPAPLDAPQHLAEVEVRSHQSDALRAFADRLASSTKGLAFDPDDGLSLVEAEVVALFYSPTLRRTRAEAAVAHAGLEHVGQWEDPSLGIDAERVLEDVDDRWVVGGTLNLTIPISGRTGVRRGMRQAEADAASLGVAEAERDLLAELRGTWVEWSAQVERVAGLKETVDRLNRLALESAALADAGELSPLDARAIRIERVQRSAELLMAEAGELESAMRLRSLIGLRADADVTLVPALAIEAPAQVSPEAHPRFLKEQADLRAFEQAYELEVRRQIPDLSVGLGYGVDQGDARLLFNGLIPVPVWNANHEAIAQSRARRDSARENAAATLELLDAELAAAKLARQSAEARHRLIVEELVPLAEQQSSDAERLGRAGEANTLLLLDAIQRQVAARLAVIEATRDVALASIRLAAFDSEHLTTIHPTTTPTQTEATP